MAIRMYSDRRDAGRRLAASLLPYDRPRPLVLGLPRGGIPVAAEVATALGGELDRRERRQRGRDQRRRCRGGLRQRRIGRRGGRVPKRVVQRIEETEAQTAGNRRMTLTFAFNYGGRAEILDAVRSILQNGVRPEDLTVEKNRYSAFIQGSSDLADVLRARGLDTLLITGTTTNGDKFRTYALQDPQLTNRLLEKGVTINALVILTPPGESFRPEHTNPPGGLEKYFQDSVIGGNVFLTNSVPAGSIVYQTSQFRVRRAHDGFEDADFVI